MLRTGPSPVSLSVEIGGHGWRCTVEPRHEHRRIPEARGGGGSDVVFSFAARACAAGTPHAEVFGGRCRGRRCRGWSAKKRGEGAATARVGDRAKGGLSPRSGCG